MSGQAATNAEIKYLENTIQDSAKDLNPAQQQTLEAQLQRINELSGYKKALALVDPLSFAYWEDQDRQAEQPTGDIIADTENAERELTALWHAFTPKQQALLRQDQRWWIKQKDAAKGQEKLGMIKDRIHYFQRLQRGEESWSLD